MGCSELCCCPQLFPERSLCDAQGLSCFSCTSPSVAINQTRCGELLCTPKPRIQAGFAEEPAAPRSPPAPAPQARGQALLCGALNSASPIATLSVQ